MIAIEATSPVPSAIDTTMDTAYTRTPRTQLRTKPPLHQLISRKQLAAKILRQQDKTDNDTPQHISHHQLQKSEIRIVGEAGNTDNGQRAGFRRHNRQRDCPPRNVAVGKKIVAHRPLPFAKPQPEQRDARQVQPNNQQIDSIQSQAILPVETRLAPSPPRAADSPHCTRMFCLKTAT